MNFSNINISGRTDIGQYLDISGGVNYNLYVFDTAANNHTGAYVNKFLLKEHGKFGNLTSGLTQFINIL